MKTHKVIDLTYHEDENNECYSGTHGECLDFIEEQRTVGMEVVPLVGDEIKHYNYDLAYCDNCIQMTNHYQGVCQKCENEQINDNSETTNDKILSKEEYYQDLCKKFIATAAKFDWFIKRYYGEDLLLDLHELATGGNGQKLVDILNNIWFDLPDSRFNVIENPPGWNEFLDIITP